MNFPREVKQLEKRTYNVIEFPREEVFKHPRNIKGNTNKVCKVTLQNFRVNHPKECVVALVTKIGFGKRD